jgi:hypothetical protein
VSLSHSNAGLERDEHGQNALAPFVYLGTVALGVGVPALLYGGAGRDLAQVAATVLVYALLSLVMRRTGPWGRGAWSMAIAAVVAIMHDEPRRPCSPIEHYCDSVDFGVQFDFVAYAIGVGIAIAWERVIGRGLRRISTNPPDGQHVGSS